MNVSFGGECGASCRAVLRVGSVSREITLQLRSDDARAGVSVGVIDLSLADGRKEILLRQQTGDDEISWSAVDVATFRNGRLDYYELWGLTWPGNRSEVSIDGRGQILLLFDSCAQTIRVRYELTTTGALTKIDETTRPTPHAAQCSG
jgi:hypothetical protein